ncbi:MAG: nitroreductase family protein [Bacteroidales bacterium]|nr:nitroreductase family protein [Bacteroidales bacterium]
MLDKNLSEHAEFDGGITAQTILPGATAARFGGCIIRLQNKFTLSRHFNLDKKSVILIMIALGKPNQIFVQKDLIADESIDY